VLISLLLILGGVIFFTDWRARTEKLADLNRRINGIFKTTLPGKPLVDPVHQLRIAIKDVQKNILSPASEKGVRTIDILNEISTRIPGDVTVQFRRFSLAGGQIQIAGKTDGYNTAVNIRERLEKSEMFEKVELIKTEKDKGGGVQFKMKVTLK